MVDLLLSFFVIYVFFRSFLAKLNMKSTRAYLVISILMVITFFTARNAYTLIFQGPVLKLDLSHNLKLSRFWIWNFIEHLKFNVKYSGHTWLKDDGFKCVCTVVLGPLGTLVLALYVCKTDMLMKFPHLAPLLADLETLKSLFFYAVKSMR